MISSFDLVFFFNVGRSSDCKLLLFAGAVAAAEEASRAYLGNQQRGLRSRESSEQVVRR